MAEKKEKIIYIAKNDDTMTGIANLWQPGFGREAS